MSREIDLEHVYLRDIIYDYRIEVLIEDLEHFKDKYNDVGLHIEWARDLDGCEYIRLYKKEAE